MKRSTTKFILILILVLGMLVGADRMLFNSRIQGFTTGFFMAPVQKLFRISSNSENSVSGLWHWRTLSDKNDRLEKENMELIRMTAELEELQRQNIFYREALSLDLPETKTVEAGIFNINSIPGYYRGLLNKGSESGVTEGDIVITEEGILVGRVERVFSKYAEVMLPMDPGFRVTARALGTKTEGLVTGAMQDGLNLDLVTQEEEIKEGDILVTKGNDNYPAGLVVGKVSKISTHEGQIFKKITAQPMLDRENLSWVLIIKR